MVLHNKVGPCGACLDLAGARRSHARLESKRTVDKSKVENLIATRLEARKAKNSPESDRIRDELAAMGVVLKDSKDGTTWEIAR